MRRLLLLLLPAVMLTVTATAKRQPTEKDMGAYLFTFFNDATHSLFMAVSYDGYTFTAVNDGKPVISGDTIAGQRGIRDPHILRGEDGAFYMVIILKINGICELQDFYRCLVVSLQDSCNWITRRL